MTRQGEKKRQKAKGKEKHTNQCRFSSLELLHLFFSSEHRFRYVFADILESERSYVSDLQRIIEIYLYELTRQECPWFVKEKKDLLFSNIEDIFAFHKVYVYLLSFLIIDLIFQSISFPLHRLDYSTMI